MNCALYYSYKNFKDTLFIIFDHDKNMTSFKRINDVTAIYHDDEIIGYNIFHVNQYIKIILNGVVISLPEIIINMINNVISSCGFSTLIKTYPNSYKIVKIISSEEIKVNDKIIKISMPNSVKVGKFAVLCNKNDVLLDLSISHEDHLLSEEELNISNENKIYYIEENDLENQDYFLFKGVN